VTLNGSLKVLQPLTTDKPALRGAKQDIETAKNYDMNLALKLQGTHIFDCDLYKEDKEVTPEDVLQLTGTETTTYEKIKDLTTKVGNFERFDRGNSQFIDVVSYYRYSETNTLDFGVIEIFEKVQGGDVASRSKLTLPSTFRSVSSVSQNNMVFSAILTNEGIASSLKLALTSGTTLSSKTIDIRSYNFFERADVFTLPSESANGVTKLVVIGWSKYMKSLTAYTLTVTVPTDPEQLNFWTLDVDQTVQTTDSSLSVNDYDWVDNSTFINFYVVSGKESKASRVTFDKKTKLFKYDKTLKTIKFETEQGKKDSVVYSVGCSKSHPYSSKDRCAFSTYAAVVYYVEMDNADEKPTASNLSQGIFVKVDRSLRLRRIGNNFAKYVYVTGQYVVAETERIQTTDTKNAIIWDITKYDDNYTGDFGAMSIIKLTTEQDKTDQQSNFDSEIINTVEIFTSQEELQGSYIAVLNFSRTDFTYTVGLKRLNIFELEVKSLPAEAEFNKYSLKCEAQGSADLQVLTVPLTDVFTWKAPTQPSEELSIAYD